MFSRGRIRAWSPQERLVQRPRANHDNGDVRFIRRCNCFGETRFVVRPELTAFGKVDFDRRVSKELDETLKWRYAIICRIEEDIVAELIVR